MSRLTNLLGGAALIAVAIFGDPGQPGFGRGQTALSLGGAALALAALLPSDWNKKLLLALGSSLLGLFLTEAVLQAFFRSEFSTVYERDPHAIYRYIPNSTKKVPRPAVQGGEPITVRINSQGFRGDELRNPGEMKRIVVYGDSNVAAEFSALEHTFVERLEAGLASKLESDIESVNAGVVGYGPDQVSVRIEDELRVLRPDLIVVVLCGHNDFGDLLRNSLFRLDSSGELRPNDFVLSGSLQATFHLAKNGPIVYKSLLKAWYQINYGSTPLTPLSPLSEDKEPSRRRTEQMEAWLDENQEEYRSHVIRMSDEVTNLLTDPYDADLALAPQSASAVYKVRLMTRVLERIEYLTERSGVRLLLVILPSPIDLDPEFAYAIRGNPRFREHRPAAITDAFQDIAVHNRIPYVNLFESFGKRPRTDFYFPEPDTHWNDEGQELAARLTAQYVLDHGLLGPRHPATAP